MPLVRFIKNALEKFIFYVNIGSDTAHNEIIKFNTNVSMPSSKIDQFLLDLLGKTGYQELDNKDKGKQCYHGECASAVVEKVQLRNPDYQFLHVGVDIHRRDLQTQKKERYGSPRGNIEIKYVHKQDPSKHLVVNLHIYFKDNCSASLAVIVALLKSDTLQMVSEKQLEKMTLDNFKDYGFKLSDHEANLKTYRLMMQQPQQDHFVKPYLFSTTSIINSQKQRFPQHP
jgi:hypothetical protein